MLRKKPDCGAVGLLRAGGGCAGGLASPPNIVDWAFYSSVSSVFCSDIGGRTFCTSMGRSSSFLPQSSSYRHLVFSCRVAEDGILASAAEPATLLPSPAPAHSSLVPASKNPEHCVRISLCSRYRCSLRPLLITISTSPVCVKMGNSFSGWVVDPPNCDRCGRCLRTVDARDECDDTDGGRRIASVRSALAESG
jgi:hypothetical protein